MLFEGGLLHTKSMTIDGAISLFGSLNLDPRSLQLNFEITLAVYDERLRHRTSAHSSRAISTGPRCWTSPRGKRERRSPGSRRTRRGWPGRFCESGFSEHEATCRFARRGRRL